jgi:hypothetical protein
VRVDEKGRRNKELSHFVSVSLDFEFAMVKAVRNGDLMFRCVDVAETQEDNDRKGCDY